MTQAEAQALITKYLNGECAPDEKALVLQAYRVLAETSDASLPDDRAAALKDEVWTNLQHHAAATKAHPSRLRYLPLAAALILAFSVGVYVWRQGQHPTEQPSTTVDIAPGGNKATLTLADGRTIDLSTEQSGIIVGEGITYLDGTEILDDRQQTTDNRQAAGKESLGSSVSRLLSLTTPKGGTYQVTLPDGSKVWLNANSTLTYPSRFTGDERVVFLEGEAFFDIKSMPLRSSGERKGSHAGLSLASGETPLREKGKMPFKVVSNGQQVEVLGTEFNISAYLDDPETKTVLVEGSVKVASTNNNQPPITIKPGQQATLNSDRITASEVDIQAAIAWKDGFFRFRGERIETIMKQLSRWYDIDVDFAAKPSDDGYTGRISRYRNISQVLAMLEKTKAVKFKIEGRRVIVME